MSCERSPSPARGSAQALNNKAAQSRPSGTFLAIPPSFYLIPIHVTAISSVLGTVRPVPKRLLRLVRDGFPDQPVLDTAISDTLLRGAARRRYPETLRMYRPGPVVAFGRQDVVSAGYQVAVAAARDRGFSSVERLAGGRAAVFHPGTIALAWAMPLDEPRLGIDERFDLVAGLIVDTLRQLQIEAQIGEVPGEYCPGSHSVSAGGRVKLFGVGQRIISKAAHIGGVLVVDGADKINEVLDPVYGALGFSWRPEATGDIRGERPDVSYADVQTALLTQLEARFTISEENLSPRTIELAAAQTDRFRSPE